MDKIKMIKIDKEFVRLHTEQIVYLEADRNSCNIYLSVKRAPLVVSGTFTHWLEMLGDNLIQIKRGTAINPEYVNKVSKTGVALTHRESAKEFVVAKKHSEELLKRFELLC